MKLSCKELKKMARQTLSNRYSTPVGAYILIELILFLLLLPFVLLFSKEDNAFSISIYILANFMISLLRTLFSCGIIKLLFSMIRKEPYQISDIFYCFRHNPDRYIIVAFVTSIPSFLLQLPFIFLNNLAELSEHTYVLYGLNIAHYLLQLLVLITITLHFGLSNFLLLERPELTPVEVLKESFRLLKGNKGRMLYIILSFIGMFILGTLSFFLGFLWISPYLHTTLCFFYLNVTNQLPAYDVTI